MSEHHARIAWKKETESFDYEEYNRNHEWTFGGGMAVPAASAPEFKGDPTRANPEEAFVVAVSSCHMLTFLAICARKRLTVLSYVDNPVGTLEPREDKKLWMSKVVLRPRVEFEGEAPDAETIQRLHASSHRNCFIANSVTTEVTVE
jgi:organic hydroperoxide reductase OsmC/OhrA